MKNKCLTNQQAGPKFIIHHRSHPWLPPTDHPPTITHSRKEPPLELHWTVRHLPLCVPAQYNSISLASYLLLTVLLLSINNDGWRTPHPRRRRFEFPFETMSLLAPSSVTRRRREQTDPGNRIQQSIVPILSHLGPIPDPFYRAYLHFGHVRPFLRLKEFLLHLVQLQRERSTPPVNRLNSRASKLPNPTPIGQHRMVTPQTRTVAVLQVLIIRCHSYFTCRVSLKLLWNVYIHRRVSHRKPPPESPLALWHHEWHRQITWDPFWWWIQFHIPTSLISTHNTRAKPKPRIIKSAHSPFPVIDSETVPLASLICAAPAEAPSIAPASWSAGEKEKKETGHKFKGRKQNIIQLHH